MWEIPLLVLVIQIGFTSALNNRAYGSNSLVPIERSANSAQTRRFTDPDLLTTGSSASIEMPEPKYDSVEDNSFRSYKPVLYVYQRRRDDQGHSTRSENEASLETPPIVRLNSNNYAGTVQSSPSLSRRLYPNYRRPYSARGPANLPPTRKYKRNKNGDSSVEVSSLEGEDPSRGEADSLLSLVEKTFSRRGHNRKYHRKGNRLSDKLDADEHTAHSENSQNMRQNCRKEHTNLYNLRLGGSKSRKITNDSPLIHRLNRIGNGNSESSLRGASFPDDDETGQLTFLRLSSLEDLNLESLLLSSQDQNGLNNRKSNSRNFLRISLSPYNKLSLDEDIASDLSLESSDFQNSDLRIGRYSKPVYRSREKNLRYHGSNKATLKKLCDEDTTKTPVPHHEGNGEKLLNSRRNGNQNNNNIDDFSDEFNLDTLFDFNKEDYDDQLNLDDNLSSDLLVLPLTTQDNLSLKSALKSSDENKSKPTTDKLNFEYHWIDVLSPKNETKTNSLENGVEKDKTKDSAEILKHEYPWSDVLSPSKNKTSGLQSLTRSGSGEPEDKTKDSSDPLHLELSWNKKDTTDVLHLEYPWNGQLCPGNNKSIDLRSHDQEDKVKNTTDVLHLEFPWNDELSSDENKIGESKSLRRQTDGRQDIEPKDELKLELPWNGKTNLDNKPSSKKTALRVPDPFYLHPYLRNKNIKKHPNYFERSYDDFSQKVRLEKLKNSPLKRSKRINLRPIGRQGSNSVSVERPGAVITSPSIDCL